MLELVLKWLVLSVFGLSAIFTPRGYFKAKKALERSATDKILVEGLKTELIAAENELIKNDFVGKSVTPEDYIPQKVLSSINYAVGRHDYIEEQRYRIFHTTIVIAGILISVISLYVTALSGDSIPENATAAIFGLSIITVFASLIAVYQYNSALDHDPPYRLIADVRYWWFRYNLTKLSPDTKDNKQFNLANEVKAEREEFFSRILQLDSLNKLFREDLEQLFILHVLQRRKSESLVKLRWNLSFLIGAVALQFLLYIVTYE